MKKYKISKLSLGLLIFFSTLVIGMNYYGSIPDKIDWSNYQVYISLALIIAYFSFMAVIIFMKFPIEEYEKDFEFGEGDTIVDLSSESS